MISRALPAFDILVEYPVQHGVIGQTVAVFLVGPQLRGRGFVDDVDEE